MEKIAALHRGKAAGFNTETGVLFAVTIPL
jgi:hypothetical protein